MLGIRKSLFTTMHLLVRFLGFPANKSDGFVGNPKMHELNVGYTRAYRSRCDSIHSIHRKSRRTDLFSAMHDLIFANENGVHRGLWKQIWFPCMATEPIEIITVNIGPETGLGGGTHDTEFYVSDFDILVPDTADASDGTLV